MNSKATEQNVKILSLMERMERPMTYHQAMLNESKLLMESKRAQAGSMIEFLTKYQIHKGKFMHLGYIQLYATSAAYPTDEFYNNVITNRDAIEDNGRNLARFDKWTDKMQNTEWNNPTGRKSPKTGIKAMKDKLYPLVIKLTDYTLNWQTVKDYNAKSSEAFAKFNAARNAMSPETRALIGLKDKPEDDSDKDKEEKAGYHAFGDLGAYDIYTFGKKGSDGTFTPERETYRTNVDDENSEVPYDRNAIRHFMNNTKSQHAYYFGVDEQGNIDPLPKPLGKLLHNTDTIRQIGGITDEEQKRLANEFIEIEKKVNSANKTFLMENIAFMCGFASAPGMSGESVYCINNNPMFLFTKTKTVNKVSTTFKYLYDSVYQKMDDEQLKAILSKYARSDADELEAKGNPNIKGSTMYADDTVNN